MSLNFSGKKFPVTSQSGREYLVRVKYKETLLEDYLKVELFAKKQINIFGIKLKNLSFVFMWLYRKERGGEYDDIVEAIKKTVRLYELSVKKQSEEEAFQSLNIKKFKEWSGQC